VGNDTTNYERVDSALRQSEERFRQLANSMPQIVWAATPDGTVDYYNQRWFEFTGFSENDPNGKSWLPILHPEDIPRCAEAWSTSIKSGQIYQIEYRFKDWKTGGYRWYLTRALPMKNPEGQIVRWFGTCTDIDDQKKAMEALLQKTVELAHIKAEREQLELFTHLASHDLQEPLQKIAGFSDLLESHCADSLDEKGRGFLKRIKDGALRMSQLIDGLLEFARAGTQKRPPEPVNLETILNDVLQDLEMRINTSKAQIHAGHLPTIIADKIQIRELFHNLLSNAIKFHKINTPPIISIQSETIDAKVVKISIKDNGVGFDEKHIEKIFKPFERMHSRDEFEGTGIGLAICRKIILRHKGEITVKSKLGKGSSFVVTLPISQNTQEETVE